MGFSIQKHTHIYIQISDRESPAVKIATDNLEADIKKVVRGVQVHRSSREICRSQSDENGFSKGYAVIRIATADNGAGNMRKESYRISVQDGSLCITGADRRGTIYGIYAFCEWMGVSPWYFWADVPIREKDGLSLPEGYFVEDYPSVEYRGIFINDEEELEAWVQKYMKEPTIGVKTYERIFELLLRLKANYIWPAMHVNSFNLHPENGALAERMGIVVGTSHCDMLMRSNNREWIPWITKKGYTDAVYDYSIEGENREILKEYWRESVKQNRGFEVCYTLGMRGIHDSGFETKNLQGKSVEEVRRAKVELLERIINDQRAILQETLPCLPMMTFIPYKEVLELYDNGLQIPEDMTLVWANDNYGHIRRFPSEREKNRTGGNGIYYHNSYWASSGMSYVFLCSIPLAHTRNELQKAWNEGIRKLWVLNSGAMKPLELEISFFLRLAWEIGKEGALTEDVEAFAADWIDKMFSGGIGREASALLCDFAQLTNVRKPENMDYDIFSQTAYGDEAAVRIHQYEELFEKGNGIYERLPEEEKAAFYQTVLMRIHAGYFTNLAFYYADRSTLMHERGNMQAAALYTEKSRLFEDVRRRMLGYYNTVMLEGKWDGILNPEGYPPPRAAMMPVCTPPLAVTGKPHMRVDVWNGEEELEFLYGTGDICASNGGSLFFGEKWIEIGNTGTGAAAVSVSVPAWLEITAADTGSAQEAVKITGCEVYAEVETELRICMRVSDNCSASTGRQGEILVRSLTEKREEKVPVRATFVSKDGYAECETINGVEEDGIIRLEGETAQSSEEFHIVRRLGRGEGNLVEACRRTDSIIVDENAAMESSIAQSYFTRGKPLIYYFMARTEGSFLLEIHRFPSLCATGRIRIGISLDGGEVRVVESFSNDEWKGNWKENVLNNVDRLYIALGQVSAGSHRIALYAIDEYFAFSRLIIYTKPRKENALAGVRGRQYLPKQWDALQWCAAFYGETEIRPRAAEYVPVTSWQGEDTLAGLNVRNPAKEYAQKIVPESYLRWGNVMFMEREGSIKIDAAAALAGSRYAWTSGDLWHHCAGESYGRSGLCLYIRKRGLLWEDAASAPSLHYRFCCEGGIYTVWMLMKFDDAVMARYSVGMDGAVLPREKLYRQGNPFRYESEQIYQWVPAAKTAIAKGEHVLDIYALASGLRFDRFYMTQEEKLPPADINWTADAAIRNLL